MTGYFTEKIKESLDYRKNIVVPNFVYITIFLTIFTLLYIFASIVIIPKNGPQNFNFINERGTITVMSAIFLISAGAFSLSSAIVNLKYKDKCKWFWVILFFAFMFLGFDELLQFHERAGRIIHNIIEPPSIFRSWNDIIVIMYGPIALMGIFFLFPLGVRYPMVMEFFLMAFIFYFIHTFIDSTFQPRTVSSTIFEESFKLLSGEFLALGSFMGLLGLLWSFPINNPADS